MVSLDWKWLFIYPDQGVASVNRLVVPAGVPLHFSLTSASVMNAFFVPQLGSMIYAMNGMATHAQSAGRPARASTCGESAQFSGDGFADMHFDSRRGASPSQFAAWVARARSAGRALRSTRRYRGLAAARACRRTPFTYRAVRPALFQAIVRRQLPPGAGPRGRSRPTCIRRSCNDLLGKLTWQAIPFDQPIPLVAAAVVVLVVIGAFSPGSSSRATCPISGASGSPASITSASASCTACSAVLMLLRGVHRRDHDAHAAGAGLPRRRATCRPSTTIRSSRRTARS